jgi:hypothetical protein
MKAQKAVSGLFAGLIASAAVCPMCSICQCAYAEDISEIAAISVEQTVADTEGNFTARVYLDELPKTGLSAVDFAIACDPAAVSISNVTLLYDTGADDAEAAVNPTLKGTVFTYEVTGEELQIRWATALVEPEYWLSEARAFFAFSGKLNTDAVSPGSCTALRIVPANREGVEYSAVVAGYMDEQGQAYTCETRLTDGAVWMPIDETGATKYGDINLDGRITLSDAVLLQRAVTEEQTLCAAAYANADCEHDGMLTITDVTLILRTLLEEEDADAAVPAAD